ncbi:hypothetical protein [Humibacter sp.]|uniref:hypothetical protein n=1 Tax=Humibacter sp. TaxID=1940291 RepID=UPI003F81E764
MRRIVYAGTVFYTGDSIAEALLDYARALASRRLADAVFVPGRLTSGEVDQIEVLIGPSSQLVSEPVEEYGPDIEDDPTVAELQNRTERIDALPAGE